MNETFLGVILKISLLEGNGWKAPGKAKMKESLEVRTSLSHYATHIDVWSKTMSAMKLTCDQVLVLVDVKLHAAQTL